MDLKSGIDEQGQRCSSVKESNRNKILGSLESELTKSQFRLVDNGQKVTLEIQTFFQGKLGRVCSMRMQVKDWHSFLVKDSRFHKNQKPSEIFKQ